MATIATNDSEVPTLSPEQKKKILDYIEPFIRVTPSLSDHRARCEKIDKLIEHSVNSNSQDDCKDEEKIPEEENITVPIIGPQLSTLSAELVKLFLSEDPPLQMVSAPKSEIISNQYNLLFSKYSRQFQWRRNLMLCIRDVVNYNICAAEVYWKRRLGKSFTQGLNNAGQKATTEAFEFGEAIEHLNIYNVSWDASVPANMVPYEAAYAGYFKKFTRVALVQYLRNMGIDVSKALFDEIKKGEGEALSDYYIPKINPVSTPDTVPANDPDSMFDNSSKEKAPLTSTVEHVCKIFYFRIIPADFGLVSTADDVTEVAIYRVIIVNKGTLVDFRRMSFQHNMIPMTFGQIDETAIGLNTLTIAEELSPLQNTAEKLYKGDIASIRRMVADRGIYDPKYVEEDHINSPSPTAKIPIKKTYSGSIKLSDVYFPIPYEDRSIGSRIQIANGLMGFAAEITSANQIMRGGFVKGNKTAQEFQATMQSAGNRILAFAIFFDDQFLGPVRTIARSDLLQNQSNISIYDKATGEFVPIDVSQLQESQVDFDIAAGLLPAEALNSVDFLQTIFQVVMSNPQFNMEYDVMSMLSYIASIKGLRYLNRFARTEEEKKKIQDMQLQQLAAQQGIKNGQNPNNPGNGSQQNPTS